MLPLSMHWPVCPGLLGCLNSYSTSCTWGVHQPFLCSLPSWGGPGCPSHLAGTRGGPCLLLVSREPLPFAARVLKAVDSHLCFLVLVLVLSGAMHIWSLPLAEGGPRFLVGTVCPPVRFQRRVTIAVLTNVNTQLSLLGSWERWKRAYSPSSSHPPLVSPWGRRLQETLGPRVGEQC